VVGQFLTMFYLLRRGQGGGLSGITREGECGASYTEVEDGERGGWRSSGDVRYSRASCGAEREGDRSRE
jgi:hypothetical protein